MKLPSPLILGALCLVSITNLAFGDQKLPGFRKYVSHNPLSYNPFLDPSTASLQIKKDSLDHSTIINAHIRRLFSPASIKGYAFKKDGKPIGIIIEQTFYKEGESFPAQLIKEVGEITLTIAAIRTSGLTISYSRNASAPIEVAIPLPDLK